LGAKLDFSSLSGELWPAVGLSLFVLIGNPLIVMAIMGYMGYRKRTGFLAGLTVAQISEFSIIFVAMGISLGHIGQDALGLTTLVGVVTIALSTYMILYSHPLYERLSPLLKPFERKLPHRELAVEHRDGEAPPPDVVVFGMGRFGQRLSKHLKQSGLNVMGVEFDPEIVRHLRHLGMNVRFGDGQDADFVESLSLQGVDWVISALPDLDSNKALLHALRANHYGGEVAIVARDDVQGASLKRIGAPTVLYPFRDAVDFTAEHLADLIRTAKEVP
jgi:hypothetical protein